MLLGLLDMGFDGSDFCGADGENGCASSILVAAISGSFDSVCAEAVISVIDSVFNSIFFLSPLPEKGCGWLLMPS